MDIQRPPAKTVTLRVARWGNSLAIRLPVDYVRKARLLEGDTLVLSQTPDGSLSLAPGKSFDRVAFVARLRKQTAKMKMGSSVVEQMRKEARH